jgi:hypothetical protein
MQENNNPNITQNILYKMCNKNYRFFYFCRKYNNKQKKYELN